MKLFERFTAAWAVLTASSLTAIEGKPELTEENVAALEAAATQLETFKSENDTLKGQNQTHAERITELEATVEAATASETVITEALAANNMEVPEGTDVAAFVAEKINAYGKTVPPATPVAPSAADDLGDTATDEDFLTDIDRRARAKANRNKK